MSELVQGILREGKKTYAFFLDVQKAYDTVWLWVKMWELGVRGKMWRVIKEMYRSAVLLDGECSEAFDVQQGVAQGCSLSPILFSVFINGLLKEVEQAGLGVELSTIGGMLFADDFVGVSNSEEELQRLINVAHAYCCLIKDFVFSVWEERKVRLYGEHVNVHQSHSQNDSGDLRGVAGGDGELGCTSHLCDGSAHSSGCVVNGSNAMAAV